MPRTKSKAEKEKTGASKRRQTRDLVKIDPLEPDRPPFLTNEYAIKEWERLVPILAKAKMLTPLDGVALGMLCQTYATIQECIEVLAEKGPTFRSPNGHICQRPEVKILSDMQDQYLKLSKEFGLTPKARSTMKVEASGGGGGDTTRGKTQKEAEFEEYFGTERSAVAR